MEKDMRAGEKILNLSALFDLGFNQFVTISIVKLLYIIGIGLAGLVTLMFISGAFRLNTAAGVVTLLFSPLFFLFFVLIVRIYLELIIVLFRIAQNTTIMAGREDMAAPINAVPVLDNEGA